MTYLELVNKNERILKREGLNSNAIFQFLYKFDSKITDLLSFSNYINDEVPEDIVNSINDAMEQYVVKKMPLAYITNSCYFYGRNFHVDHNVFSPRPETEQWVDIVVEILKTEIPLKVLDLCCGSGVIGLTIKSEFPEFKVTLADIDNEALRNSIKNAKDKKLDVRVIQSDLFSNIEDKYDVILFNPPYIDYDYPLDESVLKYEPYNAIFSPNRGLYYYELFFKEVSKHLNNRFLLAIEIGFDLADEVISMVRNYLNIEPKVLVDSNNKDRVVLVNRL